jgi:group I intron endonuclease
MRLTDRKALSYSGIYKITNKLNQHSYIGQAKNINSRIYQHLASVENPVKSDYSYPLHQAIRKYGCDNFELDVLEKCDEELLDDREIHYISKYHTCKLDPA